MDIRLAPITVSATEDTVVVTFDTKLAEAMAALEATYPLGTLVYNEAARLVRVARCAVAEAAKVLPSQPTMFLVQLRDQNGGAVVNGKGSFQIPLSINTWPSAPAPPVDELPNEEHVPDPSGAGADAGSPA